MLPAWFHTLIVVAAPTPVFGADWESTFTPEAVAAYVVGTELNILVAPVGDVETAGRAADALTEALREGGKARLVMDTSGIGPVNRLDDQGVVDKARSQPVDQIFIVRVFPGSTDESAIAVVTMYDNSGESAGAFTGVAGTALAANKASTVDPRAVEEYRARFIWFRHRVTLSRKTGRMRTQHAPLKGEHGVLLDGSKFYEHVGRLDLAASYDTNNAIHHSLLISGSLLTLGGTIAGTIGTLGETDQCEQWRPDGTCAQYMQGDPTRMWISFGAAGVGLVALGFALFMDPHPIDPPEMRRIADEFNEGLLKALGLTEADVARASIPEEPEVEFAAAPVFAPSGCGLAVAIRF